MVFLSHRLTEFSSHLFVKKKHYAVFISPPYVILISQPYVFLSHPAIKYVQYSSRRATTCFLQIKALRCFYLTALRFFISPPYGAFISQRYKICSVRRKNKGRCTVFFHFLVFVKKALRSFYLTALRFFISPGRTQLIF